MLDQREEFILCIYTDLKESDLHKGVLEHRFRWLVFELVETFYQKGCS